MLFIISLLLSVGSLGVYSAFDSIWIIQVQSKSPYFSVILVDCAFEIIKRMTETGLLMLWHLLKAS